MRSGSFIIQQIEYALKEMLPHGVEEAKEEEEEGPAEKTAITPTPPPPPPPGSKNIPQAMGCSLPLSPFVFLFFSLSLSLSLYIYLKTYLYRTLRDVRDSKTGSLHHFSHHCRSLFHRTLLCSARAGACFLEVPSLVPTLHTSVSLQPVHLW